MRLTTFVFVAIGTIILRDATQLMAYTQPIEEPLTCDMISLARVGYGVPYTGLVTNRSYRFSVNIPPGLTGWGAAPGAPFHGFTIFLDDDAPATSCIDFMIGIHVDLPEDSSAGFRARGAVRVKVGNRSGLEMSRRGFRHGTSFDNIIVELSNPHGDCRYDITITLVTPTRDRKRTELTFRSFLSGFKFR
jgi:hypothetical protein